MSFIQPIYAAANVLPGASAGGDGASISTLENPAKNLLSVKTLSGLLTSGPVNLLNLIFIIIGLFFFANLVMAGWDYMLSSGDPKKVSAATSRIMNGFIGLIMTMTAFIVVRIVSSMLGLGGTPGTPNI